MQTAVTRSRKSAYQFRNFLNDERKNFHEIEAGLLAENKYISPKFFYDEVGRQLFDRISATEDYYVTRAEVEILADNAAEMAEIIGSDIVLIEPGCGHCTKVEYLLKKFRPDLYLAIDLDEQVLQSSTRRLIYRYPGLSCMAVAADFTDLSFLHNLLPLLRRVVFYPASTIGNFEPDDAIDFLRKIRAFTGAEGGLLIGVDLEKDAAVLDRAYNDREGVTAAFNLNILNHVNRILGSDFDPGNFYHQAYYDSRKHRVEMHLCSERRQTVMVGDNPIFIEAGESIHTENSYKYSTESFTALATEAGLVRARSWFDRKHLFSVHYFVADEGLVGDTDEHGLLAYPLKRH